MLHSMTVNINCTNLPSTGTHLIDPMMHAMNDVRNSLLLVIAEKERGKVFCIMSSYVWAVLTWRQWNGISNLVPVRYSNLRLQ